ncbi:hypothetical protein ABEO48_09060 [Bacillus licheniformis]
MTKTNEKIHVLADESLGGIKREYVEVDRKAKEGEKIVIVDKRYPGDIYENGDIFTVDREAPPGSGFVECGEATSGMNCGGLIYLGEYRVLEPTNIVHIDGPDGTERYEMVDRKAEVGEKVIITRSDDFPKGFVDFVKEFDDFFDDGSFFLNKGVPGEDFLDVDVDDYRVLVPAESSEEEPQPSDPIDVIANLATRVAELERENKRIKDEIDTLHKDNRRHGEELEALKYAAKETDGKVANLESDSDTRLFTAEEVAALLNAMRERR